MRWGMDVVAACLCKADTKVRDGDLDSALLLHKILTRWYFRTAKHWLGGVSWRKDRA